MKYQIDDACKTVDIKAVHLEDRLKYRVEDRFEVKWFCGIHLKDIEIVATTSHGKYVVKNVDMWPFDEETVVDEAYLERLEKR